MSRVGNSEIILRKNVNVRFLNNIVSVVSNKGTLNFEINSLISVKLENNKILVSKNLESRKSESLQGLYRSLLYNAVVGLSDGFQKILELHGVGYRASIVGRILELSLGFSHIVKFDIPDGIDIKVEKQTTLIISGYNKELVGQVAAKIRSFRPPEPYLGKGVRYQNEQIRRKAGKSAGK